MNPMPRFDACIGIDYSGAATAERGLTGLRVYEATAGGPITEIRPTPSGRQHWSRRALAAWLETRLLTDDRVLVGIDHGFAFPGAWFDAHGVARDWDVFLDDFCRHWPTDQPDTPVESIRRGECGDGLARLGNARWRRHTEHPVGAKSVFHFDVPGSVAKSTHAGLPWINRLRHRLGPRLHAWPFDGWSIPADRSAIAEIYPSLWAADYPRDGRTADQQDAYSVARALQAADQNHQLDACLEPTLDATTAAAAAYEGWILGVTGV
ncbi:hypothetical protein FPL11_09675 [Spiribacter aquaticus]|uniref:DUF429 domain-containing protein n=2 Tax=Ectothiorhodospiraceae TaxID=72276 RepID=A0A557RFJ4_9GAMM|nr:hypothetical protein BA897_07310 [Spiribacter roseus]TVO63913.1 hypothetical protein FPL11_09675 [Spiribacter aquaticus]